jgi:sRNA-binding carbon storage regulator CsrA
MFVASRRKSESVDLIVKASLVDQKIRVHVLKIGMNRAKLGVEANKEIVKILRTELEPLEVGGERPSRVEGLLS